MRSTDKPGNSIGLLQIASKGPVLKLDNVQIKASIYAKSIKENVFILWYSKKLLHTL